MSIGRRQLKQIYFFLFRMVGGNSAALRYVGSKKLLVILNLHQVTPKANPYYSPLHPSYFDELLRFIKPRFSITTFSRLQESVGDPRPPLILSFDDGYFNYVEYALPLLEKYRCPSNQNVIVNCVKSGQPPDGFRLYDFLDQAPRSLIDEISLPGLELRLRSGSFDDKARYGLRLSRFLKMRPRAEAAPCWQMLNAVISKFDQLQTSRMMTAQDVRDLPVEHEVGCHSMRHDSMEFETDTYFSDDLMASEAFFAEDLKLPLRIYAFPNGSYRQSQIDFLLQRGIEHVLLVGDDYSRVSHRVHKRFSYFAESISEVRARAIGFTNTLSPLRS